MYDYNTVSGRAVERLNVNQRKCRFLHAAKVRRTFDTRQRVSDAELIRIKNIDYAARRPKGRTVWSIAQQDFIEI